MSLSKLLRFCTICIHLGLLFALAQLDARAQGYIFNQQSLSDFASPSAIAQGDFNGDGIMDFVVTLSNPCQPGTNCGYIHVYLGQAGGGYVLATSFFQGMNTLGPISIAVGDVNGDKKNDLVFLPQNGSPGDVIVQLGNGDGTFQSPIVTITLASMGDSLILGDFNGDGKLDAAFLETDRSATSPGVYVLLGNGDGTFKNPAFFSFNGCGQYSPRQLIAADFRNTKKLDLAVACYSELEVLLGNGDGTFASGTEYFTYSEALVAADLNKDGVPDIVTRTQTGVAALLGNGDGTFQLPISTTVPGNPGSVAAADFNGDGKMDLAAAGGWTGIVILLGNGNGTFQAAEYAYGGSEAVIPGILVGDYNFDGKPDLATPPYYDASGAFSILTNNGDGTFGAGGDLAGINSPQQAVTGDFNGDGKLDFALTDYTAASSPVVSVYLGKGNGTFQTPAAYAVGNAPQGVATADLNHDKLLDLVVANYGDNTVSVLLGKSRGTFGAQTTYPTGSQPRAIVIADVNNDGNPDLVIADFGDTNVTVLLGKSNGTFLPATFWTTGQTANSSVAIADFNGDGKLDLAVGSPAPYPTGQVALLFGNGDGTFQNATYLPTPNASNFTLMAVGTASLRGNGISDLIVTNANGQSLYIYLGKGDGTFATPIASPSTPGYAIQFGDVNGDGKLDVALAGSNSFASVSLGNGDGTFQTQMMFAAPRTAENIYASSVALGDFTGDGSLDMLAVSCCVPNSTNGFVTLFLSNPVAVFSATSLNFGKVSVGSSSTMNLTVTNQSTVKMTVKSITFTGTAAADYSQTNTCGTTLAGQASCVVSVTFKPSSKTTRNATLNFADSAAGKTRTVAMSGSGK